MPPRMKTLRAVSFIIVLLLVAACDFGGGGQELAAVPTVMELPTLTPSDTPTATFTPTDTLTPTTTFTPSNTPTVTPSPTFTPSVTFTPSMTFTPSVTPTATATDTPVPTDTPIPTVTPNKPQIISLSANPTTGSPGSVVTLSWQSVADSARIDQMNVQGAVVNSFNVTPSGSLPVTLPDSQGNQIIYRLVAIRGNQEAATSVPITVTCAIPWFFGNQYAQQAGTGCPTSLGTIDDGSFQPFENGVMIYVESQDRVYGLQNEGQRYISYDNDWDGGTKYDCADGDDEEPDGIFSWVYCNTLASGGTWDDLIGEATDDQDEDDRTYQKSDTGVFFIDAPNGAVYRFSGDRSGGTWQRVR